MNIGKNTANLLPPLLPPLTSRNLLDTNTLMPENRTSKDSKYLKSLDTALLTTKAKDDIHKASEYRINKKLREQNKLTADTKGGKLTRRRKHKKMLTRCKKHKKMLTRCRKHKK